MLFRNISIDENFPLKVFISNFYDDFLESSIDLTVRTAATNLDVTITRAHEGYPPEQSRGCLPFICRHKPSQAKKRTRRPETGIKDGFEEIKHEFLFGTFRAGKQDYLFRCSVASGKFSLERTKKVVCSIIF